MFLAEKALPPMRERAFSALAHSGALRAQSGVRPPIIFNTVLIRLAWHNFQYY